MVQKVALFVFAYTTRRLNRRFCYSVTNVLLKPIKMEFSGYSILRNIVSGQCSKRESSDLLSFTRTPPSYSMQWFLVQLYS